MKDSDTFRKLILRIAEGNAEAFKELYDIYFQKVFQFSRYFVRSKDICQEIVSDVFISIWNNRKKIPDIENLDSYIYTITKNKAFDYLNKLSREPEWVRDLPLGIATKEFDPEDTLLYKELEQAVNQAIEELPERCKLVFLMSREEGLTYHDIAHILSISPKTVNAQMVTAIKKLGHTLKKYFFIFVG